MAPADLLLFERGHVYSLDLDQKANPHRAENKVLLVDDEPQLRDLCRIFLESRGFKVDVAEDGEQALTALREKRYSLLITDHLMPKMSGLELVRQLRAEGNFIPSILISGDLPVHEFDLRQLFSAGGLLAKPFSMSQFLMAVDDLLASAQEAA